MTRRRRRLLLLLTLTLVGALTWLHLNDVSARWLEVALSGVFHREVTIEGLRFHAYPAQVEILGLRVAGSRPGAAPFLEVPRTLAAPSLSQVWEQRLVLSRLRLEGLIVRVNAPPGGGDDIPKIGGPGGGRSRFRVERLQIDSGSLHLDHERVPLQLDLPAIEVDLGPLGGLLLGSLSVGPGPARFGEKPPLDLRTRVTIAADGPDLTLRQGRLQAQGTDLAYTGKLRLSGRLAGRFDLTGPTDLEVLDRHVFGSGFGLAGQARFAGHVGVDGPTLTIGGRLSGTEGRFDGVPVPRFDGQVDRDPGGVRLSGLEVETLGGGGRLDITIPPPPGTVLLKAQVRDADAEGLSRLIFDVGAASLAAAASGTIDVRWPRGQARRISGGVALDLVPREDGRTPLAGRLEWRARDGVQDVLVGEFHTPSSTARLRGRIEADDRADLAVEADFRDLDAADDVGVRLRRALGTGEARPLGVAGRGTFRGRWLGTLQAPVWDGHFAGDEVAYLGVNWGHVDWTGSADAAEVRSRALLLQKAGAELRLSGRNETGVLGGHDGVDVDVQFRDWPAADFMQSLELPARLEGPLTGRTRISGRRSAPHGPLTVRGSGGTYYGVRYTDLSLESELRGLVTETRAGSASVGGGRIAFRGTLTSDAVYDGSAEAEAVDASALLPEVGPDLGWGGSVSGRIRLQGKLEAPTLDLEVRSPRLFLGDEGVGALDARATATGDGQVSFEGTCRSPRVDLSVKGRTGAAEPYPGELTAVARKTSLDPFLRALWPELPSWVGIVTTGALEVSGPFGKPDELEADAAVPELSLLIPEYPVSNPGPMRFALREGRLVLHDARLAGEGTDLGVEGSASLREDAPLDLSVQGAADLRVLSALTRRLRGAGAARLSVRIGGSRREPRVDGRLDADGAGIRVRGFPHGLEELRGTLAFNEKLAQFAHVSARVGGGPVDLSGQAAYAGGKLATFDVEATGKGISLRYPEGLRSTLDASLRCFGDGDRQWVTGRIDVLQALWNRRYDVASELLATPAAARTASTLSEGLRYDVKVAIPGTLKVDNNLATLQASADLNLRGTYDVPVVQGRAQIEKGRVYFQGNTYAIRRGTLEFADPQRTDPLFDIEAETRLRTYRVTLRVQGTLERVVPTLSSDPPLSALQILNLLAGADESTVASVAQSQARTQNLAATGAATLAAGRLSEEVGLERGAEKLFGLNRFSIDPTLVKGNLANPAARVTVGKRITPDFSVLYSQDLRGAQERLVALEYSLSDRLSLLLTRTDADGLGFDVRFRHH